MLFLILLKQVSVNFTEVLETSIHTLRLSISGSQTFVKYEGEYNAYFGIKFNN